MVRMVLKVQRGRKASGVHKVYKASEDRKAPKAYPALTVKTA